MEYDWFVAASSSFLFFPLHHLGCFYRRLLVDIHCDVHTHTENNLLWDLFQRFHIRLHHRLLFVLISGPN